MRHRLLRRSFVHLNGVGPRTEQSLWSRGIADWDVLLGDVKQAFKGKRLDDVQRALDESLEAWERADLYYFHRALPSNERWRMIQGGEDDIAYFDIEASNGGMPPSVESTTIAFYFRGEILQEHEHARKRVLIERMLEESSMLCTYSGASYDVPFLSAEFHIRFAKAHVDLCPWLRRQGFKGGLKGIQKANPHLHQRSSMDIDGFDAITLWRMHLDGVPRALETLQTYNAEDALILAPLLVEAFNREVAARPQLAIEQLIHEPLPLLPTDVCPRVYERLRAAPRSGFSSMYRAPSTTL